MFKAWLWVVMVGVVACITAANAVEEKAASPWWRAEPIRILVDKVFALSTAGHEIAPEDFAVIRDVGFNVICPRWGAEDNDRIRRDLALAERNGLLYLLWLRGTLTAPKGDPHCLTWADGTVQNLYSPNSAALWAMLQERILSYARLSRGTVLKGVFLDFENYAENKRGNGYSLSYDRPTLDAFAAEQKVSIPDLPPLERKQWLDKNGLHDAFERWQRALWRERAQQLRHRVDEINADFMFIVYPYADTPFLYEVMPGWATGRAPSVVASALTYRTGQLPFDDRYMLERNAADVRREVAELKARKFPFLYIGGIDPIVSGADPEFCGKNASVTCQNSNGYWVFYEGPKPASPEHNRYMAWFSKANHDVISGCYRLAQMPRRAQALPTITRTPGVHPVAILGEPRDALFKVFAEAPDFKARVMEGATLEYLQQFDLVVLQDAAVPAKDRPALHELLRRYVEQGGAVLLAHKTLTEFGSPFPDILAGIGKPPRGAPVSGPFVDDTTMIVAEDALAGFARGERIEFHWGQHYVLNPGPRGRVILRNEYDAATVVVGAHGRGRVAFVSPHLGRGKSPTPRQRDFLIALSRWLVSR
jgi:hypothetical protein